MTPEFSRRFDIRALPSGPLKLEANPNECAALAERIGIEAVERLAAEVTLLPADGAIEASGRIDATVVQLCAISNEPFTLRISEPLALRFVEANPSHSTDEETEIEIDSETCDEIPYVGTHFDLGEEIAQSLALTIDPYATGPDADRVRTETGLSDEASSGPFAALAALRK
ncbi:MAG: DUF177 domain-containing protein [Novosphingobium sp.]|nr:DUF177 domain-containing protein [Novosphingobium sp.]